MVNREREEFSHFSQKEGNAAHALVVWSCFQNLEKLEAPAKFSLKRTCELLNAVLLKFSSKGCKSYQRISISLLLSLSLLKIQSFQWYLERWLRIFLAATEWNWLQKMSLHLNRSFIFYFYQSGKEEKKKSSWTYSTHVELVSKRCGLFTSYVIKTNEISSVTWSLRCFTPQEKHRYRKHSEGNFVINDADDSSTSKRHQYFRKNWTTEL